MSTSTKVPTFLSVRNWPEITWWRFDVGYVLSKVSNEQSVTLNRLYLDFDGVGDDAVHPGVCERVKVLVRPPHELGF